MQRSASSGVKLLQRPADRNAFVAPMVRIGLSGTFTCNPGVQEVALKRHAMWRLTMCIGDYGPVCFWSAGERVEE
jgi:hypothetical protein